MSKNNDPKTDELMNKCDQDISIRKQAITQVFIFIILVFN